LVLLDQEPDLERVLVSPYLSIAAKLQLVRVVLAGRVTDLTMHFLATVVGHRRTALLRSILMRYGQLWDHHHGVTDVGVTLIEPADDAEAARFSREIAGALGRPIRLKIGVDPAILGGVMIRYSGHVVDNTIRGRLGRAIQQTLQQVKSRAYEI